MKRSLFIVLVLLLIPVIAAGCTTSSPMVTVTPGTTPAPTITSNPEPSANVSIKDLAFKPDVVTIAKGGTVTWTNDDGIPHSVVFGSDQSPTMPAGGTYSKSFSAAGTFDYHCGIHPTMRGTVKVI